MDRMDRLNALARRDTERDATLAAAITLLREFAAPWACVDTQGYLVGDVCGVCEQIVRKDGEEAPDIDINHNSDCAVLRARAFLARHPEPRKETTQ